MLDWQFKSPKANSLTEGELFSLLLKLNRIFQRRLESRGRGRDETVGSDGMVLLCPLRGNYTVKGLCSKCLEFPFYISLSP